MRLDKFLKVSRLIKRRSVANKVSELGRVLVNGSVAKPAKQIKIGDVIEIAFGNRVLRVEVVDVAENVKKTDATAMYREL